MKERSGISDRSFDQRLHANGFGGVEATRARRSSEAAMTATMRRGRTWIRRCYGLVAARAGRS